MPNQHKQIPADVLRNDRLLEQHFADLMNFPGWHSERITEWIDLVSPGQGITAHLSHFHTTEEGQFIIEVTESKTLGGNLMTLPQLIRKVREINERSQQRIGRPLLVLLFS